LENLASGKLSWVEGESLTAEGRTTPVEVRANRVEFGGKSRLAAACPGHHAASGVGSGLAKLGNALPFRLGKFRGRHEADRPERLIIAVNSAFCRLVGMEAGALEGKPFTVVFAESENLRN